jgi:hypothetical protein
MSFISQPDEEGITMFRPGNALALVGNCIIVKCNSEDDATVLLELFKSMIGKNVFIQETEPD